MSEQGTEIDSLQSPQNPPTRNLSRLATRAALVLASVGTIAIPDAPVYLTSNNQAPTQRPVNIPKGQPDLVWQDWTHQPPTATPEPLTEQKNPPPVNIPGNREQWSQSLDGEATLTRTTKDGHTLIIIAAEHFSRKAGDFFQDDIAQEIQDPSQWVFLVEGLGSGIYETKIAADIARSKGIPVKDPIFSPFEKHIIELYLNSGRQTPPREIVIGQLAAKLAVARGTNNLTEIADILGFPLPEIMNDIQLASREQTRNPEQYKRLTQQMYDDLTVVSNIFSAQVLHYYLKYYMDRPNVVVYLGLAHAGISTLDLNSISSELHFSDKQIRAIIKERAAHQEEIRLKALGISPKPQVESPEDKLRIERITQILENIPGISEELKDTIRYWQSNLFAETDFVRRRGYKTYLSPNNSSLYQLWGTAAHLADMLDATSRENRILTSQEITMISLDLRRAADKATTEHDAQRAEEFKLLGKHVALLEQVARNLR